MREKIWDLIETKDMKNLKVLLAEAEDMEVLFAFNDLSSEEQVITFRLLSKDKALHVFEHLDTNQQQNLLHSFTDEKAREFVNELPPDDRVRLLDELPASVAKKLISLLSPDERKATNILMGYNPETAGRIMTTEYVSLGRDMTVESAIEKVRKNAKEMETIYVLFVTNSAKQLEGVITFKELLLAEPGSVLGEIMSKNAIRVYTDTDQEEVARILQELDLLAIPVVDKENRLVGIVTVDDAMDILEEEATEDMFDQAGLADITDSDEDRSDVLINGKLWSIWKVRSPFLLFAVASSMLSGFVIDGFEDALQSIAALAVFIPLIMTMGGNVGTQSSTVFVRGVATGQIQVDKFIKYFFKEIGIGLSLGILVGVVSGLVASIWQNTPMLGVVVGLALVITMTSAALLGFLIPYVLMKLKIDQAAGATPILTSLKDIMGLVIYFVLVRTFLSNML